MAPQRTRRTRKYFKRPYRPLRVYRPLRWYGGVQATQRVKCRRMVTVTDITPWTAGAHTMSSDIFRVNPMAANSWPGSIMNSGVWNSMRYMYDEWRLLGLRIAVTTPMFFTRGQATKVPVRYGDLEVLEISSQLCSLIDYAPDAQQIDVEPDTKRFNITCNGPHYVTRSVWMKPGDAKGWISCRVHSVGGDVYEMESVTGQKNPTFFWPSFHTQVLYVNCDSYANMENAPWIMGVRHFEIDYYCEFRGSTGGNIRNGYSEDYPQGSKADKADKFSNIYMFNGKIYDHMPEDEMGAFLEARKSAISSLPI